MNEIYEESKKRQPSQKDVVLSSLKLAGSTGVLNTHLNEIMLRYGQIIYELRLDGYEIKTENVSKGVVKYTLLNEEPQEKPVKKKGMEIVRDELDELDGMFYLFELEDILDRNNLQIIHKPNGLNKIVS